MNVYPLSLSRPHGQRAVVVGGGPIGQRKCAGLLSAGIPVRLISPTATAQLAEWAAAGTIDWDNRLYAPGDLASASLAFAATNDRAANAAVAQEAAAQGILCNVADAPAEGTFHTPATIRHGDVVIAISTLSADPRRAKALRERLEAWLIAQDEGCA